MRSCNLERRSPILRDSIGFISVESVVVSGALVVVVVVEVEVEVD